MQAQGHKRDWEQCCTKTKVMRSKFHFMVDVNKTRGWRVSMPFYEELSCLIANHKAIDTLHTYGITGCLEVSPAGTPPKEEGVQGGPGTMGQPAAQEQVARGHREKAEMLEPAPKESSTLLLVPVSS